MTPDIRHQQVTRYIAPLCRTGALRIYNVANLAKIANVAIIAEVVGRDENNLEGWD